MTMGKATTNSQSSFVKDFLRPSQFGSSKNAEVPAQALLALHFRRLSKPGVDSFPGAGSAVGQMFDLIVSLLLPQILMSLLKGL